MKRFRSILVIPVTSRADPPTALTEAVSLAENSGAHVKMLGHLPDVPASQWSATPRDRRSAFRQHQIDVLRDRLVAWSEQVSDGLLEVEVSSGSLPLEVADRVVRDGHDLVLVADDGTGESSAATLGLVRTCPCPVWLLRPNFTGRRVLAAVDPDHSAWTNRLILELARSQAEMHDGELRVMHAWELAGADPMAPGGSLFLSSEEAARFVTDVEAAHRAAFDHALEDAGLAGLASAHFVDGAPARAIHGLAELYRTDLLVIGAGAAGQPGIGLGSTAEQVLAEADASVLVVKPAPEASDTPTVNS